MPILQPGASLRSRDVARQTTPIRRQTPERRDVVSREQLLRRVRAEFEQMPGLQLTLPQAERLFGVREDVCLRLLATLIAEGLLCQTPDLQFANRAIPH